MLSISHWAKNSRISKIVHFCPSKLHNLKVSSIALNIRIKWEDIHTFNNSIYISHSCKTCRVYCAQVLINSIWQSSTIACVTVKLKIEMNFSQIKFLASNPRDILATHCLNGSYSSLQGFLYGERTKNYNFIPFPSAKVTLDFNVSLLSQIARIN